MGSVHTSDTYQNSPAQHHKNIYKDKFKHRYVSKRGLVNKLFCLTLGDYSLEACSRHWRSTWVPQSMFEFPAGHSSKPIQQESLTFSIFFFLTEILFQKSFSTQRGVNWLITPCHLRWAVGALESNQELDSLYLELWRV